MIRTHTAFATLAVAIAAMGATPVAFAAPVTFIATQQPGEWLAHRLVGSKVLNAQAEDIGTVKDVVVDKLGAVSAVVVGVGGFLGIPEKLVAVPYNAIHVGDVVQSSRVVVLDATKDALTAAPAYVATDPGTTERVTQKASDWMTAAKAKVMELSKMAADKAKEMSAPKDAPASGSTTPATKP
jgi:sporulation protein YlmC with PRC-barrel domain